MCFRVVFLSRDREVKNELHRYCADVAPQKLHQSPPNLGTFQVRANIYGMLANVNPNSAPPAVAENHGAVSERRSQRMKCGRCAAQFANACREAVRFGSVVGYEQGRWPMLSYQAFGEGQHVVSGLTVERRERFVEDQKSGRTQKSAGKCEAPLLAER